MSISGIGPNTIRIALTSGRLAGGAVKQTSGSSSSSTLSSDNIIYDEKDTNQDGAVSTLEEITYTLRHPGEMTGSLFDVEA